MLLGIILKNSKRAHIYKLDIVCTKCGNRNRHFYYRSASIMRLNQDTCCNCSEPLSKIEELIKTKDKRLAYHISD